MDIPTYSYSSAGQDYCLIPHLEMIVGFNCIPTFHGTLCLSWSAGSCSLRQVHAEHHVVGPLHDGNSSYVVCRNCHYPHRLGGYLSVRN